MRARASNMAGEEWPALPAQTQRDEFDLLFAAAYDELRRLARSMRQATPAAALSPTTLVNEAWLKLAGSAGLTWESPLHFKRIAAQAMRQLLIGEARRRSALKRQHGAALVITFSEELPVAAAAGCGLDELLLLETALGELARLSPRQAAIVESRFFGGLEVAETAGLLGVSEATVARDWRVAKAWLSRELRRQA
jgi:RNA polymerase sigma factor (TIGR02999 family)